MEIFENEFPEGVYIIGIDPYKGEAELGSIYVYKRDSKGNKEDYVTKYYSSQNDEENG